MFKRPTLRVSGHRQAEPGRTAEHRITYPVLCSSTLVCHPPSARRQRMQLAAPATDMPTLGDLLSEWYILRREDRCESTWAGYWTLHRQWIRHWQRDPLGGPPVGELTGQHVLDFLANQASLQTRRSWCKAATLIHAILDAAVRHRLAGGLVRAEHLPQIEIPRDRWFRDRGPVAETPGHRRRGLPALTVEDMRAAMAACRTSVFLAPAWWRATLGLLWFCGPRYADLGRLRWGHRSARGFRVSCESESLHYVETKGGGTVDVPLPAWLAGLLRDLRDAQGVRPGTDAACLVADPRPRRVAAQAATVDSSIHICPRGDFVNRGRRLAPQWCEIWHAAGVETRKPHEMRAAAISNWYAAAPQYRFAAMGHRPPPGDVQLRHYVQIGPDFRAAASRIPDPTEQS